MQGGWRKPRVHCLVCSSALRAGDLFCSACGAVVPGHPPSPPAPEAPGRIAGERKYLTVLCVDLQRSTDLISELDPEEAISRLEPALIAMRTAVRRNRGIVSKEGGDGLIALFGAPHADDNHAVMACHAAVELVRRIKLLEDPGSSRPGRHPLRLRRHPCHRGRLLLDLRGRRTGGPSGQAVRERGAGRTDPGVGILPEPLGRPRDLQAAAAEADGGISGAGSLLRARSDQRDDPLAGALDQRAVVVCRPGRADFAATARGAAGRRLRTDRRAGRNGRHRQIPPGPRVRRQPARGELAGSGSRRQSARTGRALCLAEEAAAKRAAGGPYRARGPDGVGREAPPMPTSGPRPWLRCSISPSATRAGAISSRCCGGA